MAGSTPIYGFPYPESSDLVANYPALGQDLAEDIEGVIAAIPPGGLSMVTPTSIANIGGSASATGGEVTFSGVTSISLNGIFTTTYDNYVLFMDCSSISAAAETYMRFRSSGSDTTTNTYAWTYLNTRTRPSATSNGFAEDNGVNYGRGPYSASGYRSQMILHFINPRELGNANYRGTANSYDSGYQTQVIHGVSTQASVHDGYTIYRVSGTMTGKIRVYGYKNS